MLDYQLELSRNRRDIAFSSEKITSPDCDMREFLRLVFETLHPGKKMVSNWHLDLMIEYLAAIESGNLQRLIVNLPPRSLKSICINVAWPAWLLGRSPNKRIIAVSYNQRLSEKHSIDCRTVIQSDWYKEMFPGTTLARGMNRTSRFCTTEGGFRFATSTGGTLTGEGADIIIIDDPTSASDAFSPKRRARAYEWFKSCLLSRLNDCENGRIVLVMQRLHSDDLTGMLLKSESRDLWKVLKIPAIATRDYTFSLGLFKYERKAGEHLFENAYYIDSDGRKIFLKEKNSINNLIKTQFTIDVGLIDSTMSCIKPEIVYNYKLHNHWLLWGKFCWRCNLFCDDHTLSRYNYFYCQVVKKPVNQINYDIIVEKIFANRLVDKLNQKLNMHSVNRDFNLLRREIGSTVFSIQYQQDASEALNALVKEEWLYRYDDCEAANFSDVCEIERLDNRHDTSVFDYVYQSWDCAVKCGIQNDYSVCTTWGLRNEKLYLIHTLRVKIDYPRLRESIVKMSQYFNSDAILIEDCAAGQQIIQEMHTMSCKLNVIAIRPKHDKKTRLTLVSPLFERKVVSLPRRASWLDAFLDELLHFPDCEHDDQVDSVSQFLLWYQKNEAQKYRFELNKLDLKLNYF
jgi:predicted phage terminase large subunit-like protein